jgi:carbon storage regulator
VLVITRKVGERLVIDGNTHITILALAGGKVRVGIDAPPTVTIVREELLKGFESPTAGPLLVSV